MPQNNSTVKTMRYQPKALYLVAVALLFSTSIVHLALEFKQPWVETLINAMPRPSLVHWVSQEAARDIALKSNKPILYVVTKRQHPESMQFETQILDDPNLANAINDNFVPVRRKVNPEAGYDSKDKEMRFLERLGYQDVAPWIMAVPPFMIGMDSDDIASSSNITELDVSDKTLLTKDSEFNPDAYFYNSGVHYKRYNSTMNGSCTQKGGATCSGYFNKPDFVEFLNSALRWHRLPPTTGRIGWKDNAGLDLKLPALGEKPKLLVLVEDYGQKSDLLRLNLLWKDKSVKLIEDRFEPYLIEFRRNDPAYNAGFAHLKGDYKIDKLPAIIVLDGKGGSGRGRVQYGYESTDTTMTFLRAGLSN